MIFEVRDKSGRLVRLTDIGWKHIRKEHPDVIVEEIRAAIESSTKIKQSKYDKDVKWCYKYNKNLKEYLMVSVKYLNGEGFVITAFYLKNIK